MSSPVNPSERENSVSTCMYGASDAACRECRQPFTPAKPWQVFCGDECHDRWHNRMRGGARPEIERPPVADTNAVGGNERQISQNTLSQRPTKIKRVLSELARGRSLQRFEAESLGDHCLHSTIARIEKLGIRVARREEVVRGFAGHPTRVVRYWLDEESRLRAAKFLGWARGGD